MEIHLFFRRNEKLKMKRNRAGRVKVREQFRVEMAIQIDKADDTNIQNFSHFICNLIPDQGQKAWKVASNETDLDEEEGIVSSTS